MGNVLHAIEYPAQLLLVIWFDSSDRASVSHLLDPSSPPVAEKHDGKFTWDKQKATILRNEELFPASELFDIMDNPPVIAVLPVPPPHVRPPLFVNGELKGENIHLSSPFTNKEVYLAEASTCRRVQCMMSVISSRPSLRRIMAPFDCPSCSEDEDPRNVFHWLNQVKMTGTVVLVWPSM